MTICTAILLFSLRRLFSSDILIWVAEIPILLIGITLWIYQTRQHRVLKDELRLLSRLNRHAIEYDLVMKAMKLSVWHVDVPTRTVAIESDYRDQSDDLYIPTGSNISTVLNQVAPAHIEYVRQEMEELMTGKKDEIQGQYQIRIPNSDRTYWGASFVTVDKRDANGRPLSLVGTSMRIDKQKATEQALIEARNQAEESDRLKSAFLTSISHEIRTPLNAIVGFSEVLPMAQSDEERQQLLKLINQNNEHLLRLFDDIVRMAQLEAGGKTVENSRFPLQQLFDDVTIQFKVKAEEAGLTIKTAMDDPNMQATADRSRLAEILNQYVDNAIKFTSEGTITLGYSIVEGMLRIWVSDTGRGIPAESCNDQLFERFVKLDEFVQGTGLGLSICRSLALSMSGRVGVESRLGEGSRFWVELPMR